MVPGRAEPSTILVAVGSNIEAIEPQRAATFGELVVAETLYRGLVRYQADGSITGDLAETWTVSEDGRHYKFSLEPGLTWSDGRSLDAEDIVAGILLALDHDRPAPFAARLFSIEHAEAFAAGMQGKGDVLGVVATDARTVTFKLDRRAVNFLDALAHPVAMPVPAHSPRALMHGTLTSGRYLLNKRLVDGSLLLAPTEAGPNLLVVPTRSAEEALLLAARSHGLVTAALPIIATPSVGANSDFVRVDSGETLYAYAINMARTPFERLEVRHALAMSIYRANLLDDLSIAGASLANQYVPQSVMGRLGSYKAAFAPLTIDERKAVAVALLSELGFGLETPLKVLLRIPIGDIHRAVADRIVRMWALSGIETEIIEASFPEHWQALTAGNFDVAFASWPGRRDTPLGSVEPLSRAGGPWNFPRYNFQDFSDRLRQANSFVNEERRLGYYREAEKAVIEDQAIIALFFYKPLALVSSSIRGWAPNPVGRHPLSELSLSNVGAFRRSD